MIGRPKCSRFMGHDYSIAFVPENSLQNAEKEDLCGETNHSLQAIRIEDGMHPDKERSVVLHETLHQILALGNANLPEDIEEDICSLLGDALLGHMRDNVSYWRWLMRQQKKVK